MKISFNDNYNYPFKLHQSDNKANYANHNYFTREQSFKGLEQNAERFANYLVSKPGTQWVLKNKTVNNLLKSALENPGLYEAIIALLITCTARPLTILATPGAEMEDKQYASAQSIASGISGLAFGYAAFDPIKGALDNVLIDVNGKNVKTAFQNFYNNKENATLISQLVERKIIPSAAEFNKELADGKNIFAYLKDYVKKHGYAYISDLYKGNNAEEKQTWQNLAGEYSKRIRQAFDNVKTNNVPAKKAYLIHKSLEFMKEGGYKLTPSAGAAQAGFLINYTSKIILFPLTAGVTIWAIPKIMRTIFPNHKKSKAKAKNNQTPNISPAASQAKNEFTSKTNKITLGQNNPIFSKFNTQKSNQISFSGGLSGILDVPMSIYKKGYKNPLSFVLGKLFGAISGTGYFSNKVTDLVSNAKVNKYGIEVLDRSKSGKILEKWNNDFFISNLPQIAALFGSCLYIRNTIKNKEIAPERKPTLCTNMAVVAIFSLVAGKFIDKIMNPIFEALQKTHARLMKNKLNYESHAAWKCARNLLITTFAFRYLGPVLATPTADKLVKLFNKHQEKKAK